MWIRPCVQVHQPVCVCVCVTHLSADSSSTRLLSVLVSSCSDGSSGVDWFGTVSRSLVGTATSMMTLLCIGRDGQRAEMRMQYFWQPIY